MPRKPDKKTDPANPPCVSDDPIVPSPGTGIPEDGDAINNLRREIQNLAADLNTKLDKALLNQESLLGRVADIEKKQRDMEESLSFSSSSVEELQSKNKILTEDLARMTSQMVTAQKNIADLERAALQQERYSRNFNLRFGGIPETNTKDPVVPLNQVKDLLTERFGLPDIEIENAHRTGKPPKSASDKPRHILVKFLYRSERQVILDRAKAMKASLAKSGLFILRDMPAADVAKKRSLRDVMQKAYRDGRNPVFRDGDLYINGKKYVQPAPESPRSS